MGFLMIVPSGYAQLRTLGEAKGNLALFWVRSSAKDLLFQAFLTVWMGCRSLASDMLFCLLARRSVVLD
jgi:hypothetical protein